jgi:hypothetical protein
MTARRFTSNTIDGYLRLMRRPIDVVVGLLPDGRVRSAAAARLAVDRVDASIRAVAGAALKDESLRDDARRRRATASERSRAVELRREAEGGERQAEDRLATSHEQATQRRARASSTATSRRELAAEKQQARTRSAEESERRRLAVSRQQEDRFDDQIDSAVAEARLPAVQQQAEALGEHEVALEEHDEAQRLGEAAARIKRERKDD